MNKLRRLGYFFSHGLATNLGEGKFKPAVLRPKFDLVSHPGSEGVFR